MGSPDRINIMYLGLYVDDFIYFSKSRDTKIAFERKFQFLIAVDIMGEINHFLGIKFSWKRELDDHVSVHLTQEALAYHLIDIAGLSISSPILTLYSASHPVDTMSIPTYVIPPIKLLRQTLVGSLMWISGAT